MTLIVGRRGSRGRLAAAEAVQLGADRAPGRFQVEGDTSLGDPGALLPAFAQTAFGLKTVGDKPAQALDIGAGGAAGDLAKLELRAQIGDLGKEALDLTTADVQQGHCQVVGAVASR